MSQKRRVFFRLLAPDAEEVAVVGSFSAWTEIRPLKKGKGGTWQTWMSLDPGNYEYRFLVDGCWTNDPACRERTANPFGSQNDVLIVQA
jgi:1,4-alpha-glucan branching enzyme